MGKASRARSGIVYLCWVDDGHRVIPLGQPLALRLAAWLIYIGVTNAAVRRVLIDSYSFA